MSQIKMSRLLSLLLALVMVFTCCGSVIAEETDDTDAKIEAAKTAMEAAETALNTANEKLAEANTKLADAQAAQTAAEKELADAKAALIASGVNPDDAAALEEALKAEEAKLSENAKAVEEAKAKVAEAEKAVEAQKADIAVLEGEIKNLQDTIALNQTTMDNNDAQIANYTSELEGMEATLATYKAGIDDADKAVEALKAQKDALTNQENILLAKEVELTTYEKLLADRKETLTAKEAAETAQQATIEEKQAELDDAKQKEQVAEGALNTAEDLLQKGKDVLPGLQQAVKEAENYLSSVPSFLQGAAKKALEAAQNTLAEAEAKIPGLEADVTAAKADLEAAKAATQAAQTELNNAQAALETKKAETAAAKAEVEAQEANVEATKAAIEEQKLAVAAEKAKVDELLAADPDAQKAAAEKAYNDYKANYDATKADLEQKIADLKAANEALTAKNTELAAQVTAKQADQSAANEKLAELEANVTACEAAQADLEAAAPAIEKAIADLKAELAKLEDPTYVAAKAAYETASSNVKSAKTTRDLLAVAQTAAKVAYDEAYSLYMQLIGSTNCAHDKYEISVFGNTFCLMKVAGICTHNLGSCCGSLSVSTIANNVNGYITRGDFQGLADAAQASYNSVSNVVNAFGELPSSVQNTVKDAIRSLVDAAADRAIDAAKEELKNAISNNVSSENYAAVAAAIDKAADLIKEIKTAFGKGELTEAELNSMLSSAAQSVLNKALAEIKAKIGEENLAEAKAIAEKAIAKIEALIGEVENAGGVQGALNSFKAEVEKLLKEAQDKAVAAAKAILTQALTEIKNKIDSAVENSNLNEIAQKVAAAIAKFEEAIKNLPNREELQKLIDEFKAEVEAAAKAAFEKHAAAAKEHIKEQLAALDAAAKEHIEKCIAELKAELEAYLADYHVCEYTMITVKAEIAKKVQAVREEIKDYIQGKLDAASAAELAQIKAELTKVATGICAALHIEINCDELEALINEIFAQIKENGETLVNNKIEAIDQYIDKLLTDAMISNQVILPAVDPTCVDTGLTEGLACKCGNYIYVEQEVIDAKGHGETEIRDAKEPTYFEDGYTGDVWCLVCETMIEEGEIIPKLFMPYFTMTACTEGLSFSEMSELTDDWHMFTPIDLSVDGELTFALVAGNRDVIGTVTILIEEGMLTVSYELVDDDILVSSEFLTFLPSLSETTTLDREELVNYEFGKAINIAETFGEDTKVLVYVFNEVAYPMYNDFVVPFEADAELVEELKLIMD